MKITAIVGSNSKHSSNRKLLKFMARHFDDQDITVADIDHIPMFNENYPGGDPQPVIDLANQIKASDAIIISCAEHAHTVASSLKSVIEWLSYNLHPLANQPVMIVSVSSKPQGGSRAQMALRGILNSPGVNAEAWQGNEFMLGNGNTAFDDNGDLKDEGTVKFLESCFSDFITFAGHKNASKEGA